MTAQQTAEQPALSVAAARARILASVERLAPEQVPLEQALGRVLAEEIVAGEAVPPFANSAMDGYALRAADVAQASRAQPVGLAVVADLAAGAVGERALAAGEAARIMTGAPLPPGADAVVPVEATDEWPRPAGARLPERVQIFRAVAAGDFVRPPGQDITAGTAVLPAGRVLRAADVGVLAALGRADVPVIRRPRVALLATGDELVPLREQPALGQIRNSNSYALAALVREAWGEPLDLGIARDDAEQVRARLRAGLAAGVDLFVTSAGVSVGTRDVVREVVAAEGELSFWRVNVRPGKPLAFGRAGGVPFVGLPGNPVSAMLTFELFVRPALLKLGGRPAADRARLRVTLDAPLDSDGRESYLRAIVSRYGNEYRAVLTGDQGSAIMTSLVRANALLIVPAGVRALHAGDTLEALVIGELEDERSDNPAW
jgi:molybdopterin molybdotransferase